MFGHLADEANPFPCVKKTCNEKRNLSQCPTLGSVFLVAFWVVHNQNTVLWKSSHFKMLFVSWYTGQGAGMGLLFCFLWLIYSGKKNYVNPLELPRFLHKLVTTIDKRSVLKLITHTILYFSCLYWIHTLNIHSVGWKKYVNPKANDFSKS